MSKKEQENLTEQEEININADENVSGTEHLTDPLEESQLETLENELKESKDKYIRLAAEFDNFRKRTAKERLELFQTAAKDIVVDLLDVLDDVDRASREFTEVEDGPLKQGVNLVFTIGTEFDPELHEAITEIAAPQEDLKGKVIDEITKGYYLNDKIIRHTKVVVGK